LEYKLKLLAQYGELSGVEISTVGLGKKPSGDLALRRLASAVLFLAMVDLMDAEERNASNDFFYSSELELWCGILGLDVCCVREALEDLGMLNFSKELLAKITGKEIMQYYVKTYERNGNSNPEILLDIASTYKLPYSLIHFFVYDQILPWRHIHIRRELGKNFFKKWKKRTSVYSGRGATTHFGRIIEAFRLKLAEKQNCV